MQIWSWKIEGEKSHKNSIWEALGLHLGRVWEALGRLLEALGRLLGAIFRIFSLIFGYLNSCCVFFWDFLPQDGLKSGFWEGLGEVWGRIWAGFRVIFLVSETWHHPGIVITSPGECHHITPRFPKTKPGEIMFPLDPRDGPPTRLASQFEMR